MIFLVRRLTATWRTPTRARLLYVAMAIAFVGLAIVGVATGNVFVAVTAAVVITAGTEA